MKYFPGIDSERNHYAYNDGVFENVCNVSGSSDDSPYYNPPLLPSPMAHAHVFVNNEVFKQTIFGHEAIFRNQVSELHRLYDKQKELMNELKNDFKQVNTQVTMGSSEYGLMEKKQSKVSWLSPCYVPQSVTNFQLQVGENVCACRGTRPVKCISLQTELLDEKRFKKYNNKVLDLQLLAHEYMDDEDAISSIVVEANYQDKHASPFSSGCDEHVDQRPLATGIHEKRTHAVSASALRILPDLNEPFDFEESIPTTNYEEKHFQDLTRNTTLLAVCSSAGGADTNIQGSVAIYNDVDKYENIVQLNCGHEPGKKTTHSDTSSVISSVSPSLKPKPCGEHLGVDRMLKISSKKRTLKSRKARGFLAFLENKTPDTLIRVPKSLRVIPVRNKIETHSKHILPPTQSVFDFRRNPIVIQALPCTNASMAIQKKKSKSLSRATRPDRNKGHLFEVKCNKSITKWHCSSPSSGLVKTSMKGKRRRSNLRDVDLNQHLHRMGPPSSENEECAPPRGESIENFLGSLRQFHTADDWDMETDVARDAAKTIVLLSASDVRNNRNSVFEPSHLSHKNPLHWFVELVSDVEFTTENLPTSTECKNDSMFDSLDDFESMTLRLEDMNKEENYCRSIIAGQDNKLTLVTTVSGRATRARGKRSKKLKNFQEVILPGISSLSKHEVTEDIHLIKGLMEATGTPSNFDSKKINGISRHRRQSSQATSIITKNSPCSLSDFQNETSSESQTNERKRMMIDWGKITRRRRGQRYPARKITFIFHSGFLHLIYKNSSIKFVQPYKQMYVEDKKGYKVGTGKFAKIKIRELKLLVMGFGPVGTSLFSIP